MPKIKTFEAACKALKIDPKKLPVVDRLPEEDQKSIIAHFKLRVIAKALNEGWSPNWDDSSEYKYYPYFYYEKRKGFVLVFFNYWRSDSLVGSRLCFKNSELALYAANQFRDLYNDFLSIQ